MIRTLCVLVLAVLTVKPAQGQNINFFEQRHAERNQTFFGGIVAGLNACQVDGDRYAGYHKPGLNVGLQGYARAGKCQLSIELLYAQKGARNVQLVNSPAVGTVPETYVLRLNYVEVPVMVQIPVLPRMFLGAGVSYAQLLNYKETLENNNPVNLQTDLSGFRKTDLNYLAALTVQAYENLFFKVRYQYSITTIRDADKIPPEFGTSGQYNNLFCFQLMCLF
jgi:hypothetical protein